MAGRPRKNIIVDESKRNDISRSEFDEVRDAVTEVTNFVVGGGLAEQIKNAVERAMPKTAKEIPDELMEAKMSSPEQTAVEKAIAKAKANRVSLNEDWDAAAREIIGSDWIDHTEQENTKNGGIQFTVVIKTEKSNMPQSYLDVMKCDRRTKDVTSEGTEGVIAWCRMIKQNLARGKSINALGLK